MSLALDVFLLMFTLLMLAQSYVWSRDKRAVPAKTPCIDRRWYVRDRPEGGYFILVEVL